MEDLTHTKCLYNWGCTKGEWCYSYSSMPAPETWWIRVGGIIIKREVNKLMQDGLWHV